MFCAPSHTAQKVAIHSSGAPAIHPREAGVYNGTLPCYTISRWPPRTRGRTEGTMCRAFLRRSSPIFRHFAGGAGGGRGSPAGRRHPGPVCAQPDLFCGRALGAAAAARLRAGDALSPGGGDALSEPDGGGARARAALRGDAHGLRLLCAPGGDPRATAGPCGAAAHARALRAGPWPLTWTSTAGTTAGTSSGGGLCAGGRSTFPGGCSTCWGYHAGRVVSVCDLFLCGTYAKIEDFDVSPRHQRQGFGRAMLAELIRPGEAPGGRDDLPGHGRRGYGQGNVQKERLCASRSEGRDFAAGQSGQGPRPQRARHPDGGDRPGGGRRE